MQGASVGKSSAQNGSMIRQRFSFLLPFASKMHACTGANAQRPARVGLERERNRRTKDVCSVRSFEKLIAIRPLCWGKQSIREFAEGKRRSKAQPRAFGFLLCSLRPRYAFFLCLCDFVVPVGCHRFSLQDGLCCRRLRFVQVLLWAMGYALLPNR